MNRIFKDGTHTEKRKTAQLKNMLKGHFMEQILVLNKLWSYTRNVSISFIFQKING